MRIHSITMVVLLLAITALSAGCSDDDPTAPPGIEPEIVNVTDSFEYQITDITRYTRTASYTWRNTGTQAAVDHSTTVTDGDGTLTVLDADGTQVYTGPLAASGSELSGTGTPGDWTVRLSYDNFSGTVNFRVQKG